MENTGKTYFFSREITDDRVVVSGDEFVHLVKSYRKKCGDVVHVLSGDGYTRESMLAEIKKDHALLEVKNTVFKEKATSHELWISVLKHQDRLEWLVEKCTEMEIGAIRLLLCAHTEKPHVNIPRLEKICVAAAKQSGNPYLPFIDAPVPLFDSSLHERGIPVMLAHCRKQEMRDLFSFEKTQNTAVLIGPEGDFTADEVNRLCGMNYREVSLGSSRLRSETAGLKAAVWLSLRN